MDELIEAWRALAARSRRRYDAEAEDHVQDAIVAALDARHRTGQTPEAPRSWLGTVARRREVDRVRRAQAERRAAAVWDVTGAAYDGTGEILDRHEARWLAARVEQLPPRTRDVVRGLATGASQADVATALGLTPRAVEAHVRRARIALRRALDRAGAVVALVFGRRRWRRTASVVAAGVAAAAVAGMLGPGDGTQQLIPVPKPAPAPPPATPAPGHLTYALAAAARPLPQGAPRADVPAPAAPLPPSARPPVPPSSPSPGLVPSNPVVVVPADGHPEPTTFATVAGATYLVTVSGVYSYNGRPTGLGDCGHYIKEGDLGWTPYHALEVDGGFSPCDTMPLNPAHVYEWQLRGTGRPITFRVHDDGGSGDNLGDLLVTLTRLS